MAIDKETVWKSADGLTWSQWRMSGSYPTNITEWPLDFVGGQQGILDNDMAFSRDAISWSPISLPAPAGSEALTSYPAFDGRRFIVVETLTLIGGKNQSMAFTSIDGKTWTGHVISLPADGLQVTELLASGKGILAGFGEGSGTERWMWSSDGATWKEKAALTNFAKADSFGFEIQSNGDRFLALDEPMSGKWTLWSSLDGWSWVKLKVSPGSDTLPNTGYTFLGPRGIYFKWDGECPDGGVASPCPTAPPDYPRYGAAR